jgi:uncharacterized protein
MRAVNLLIWTLILLPLCSDGQNPLGEDLKEYYFVLLHKGPHRDQDSASTAEIQRAHLDNIGRLMREGKMVVAGPFLDDGDLRGVFIFDAATREEVEKILQTDAADMKFTPG